VRITDEDTARRLLEQIRGKVADGKSLGEVLAAYQPSDATPNLVSTWLERWLRLNATQAPLAISSTLTVRFSRH
jgi:hypothetical protein